MFELLMHCICMGGTSSSTDCAMMSILKLSLINNILYFRVGYLALVRLAKLALYTLGHLFEILAPDGSDITVDKEFR